MLYASGLNLAIKFLVLGYFIAVLVLLGRISYYLKGILDKLSAPP